MPATPKPSLDDYLLSAARELGFADDPLSAERAYEINLRSARGDVEAGEVLRGLVDALKAMTLDYPGGNPDLLFNPAIKYEEFKLYQKPFKSAIEKLYRNNIFYNRNYPNPPREGAIEIVHLYQRIDDLVRTRLVCKYMDGPRYVCDALSRHCTAHGIRSKFREISTDAGYYAWHFYFQVPIVISLLGRVENTNMWIEIQLSTQLADVIGTLTHGLYEARRAGRAASERQYWKWDAASQMFRAAYIGHGLHLLEGIIQAYKDEVLGLGTPIAKGTPSEIATFDDAVVTSTPEGENNNREPQC